MAMRKYLRVFYLLLIVPVLWGCPFDSPFGLDETAAQNIDESLIGKWAAFMPKPGDEQHYREEPVKIIFEKATDLEYNVAITGYLDELKPYRFVTNDTIKGTAFLSSAAGRSFLNTFIQGKMYIAELVKSSSSMSIYPLSDHFTAKYIKNCAELRKAVEEHFKTAAQPRYDYRFMIKNLQKVN